MTRSLIAEVINPACNNTYIAGVDDTGSMPPGDSLSNNDDLKIAKIK